MINIEVNDYTATVTAKGKTSQLMTESFSLIIEGFRIMRKLNTKVYEKVKEDLFAAIITGNLDSVLAEIDENHNASQLTVDLEELKKQLAQEEEEG